MYTYSEIYPKKKISKPTKEKSHMLYIYKKSQQSHELLNHIVNSKSTSKYATHLKNKIVLISFVY
jgi:hypothetical protein